nr:MAG TPA: hypothetical protein [Caudoviricetes sp.]
MRKITDTSDIKQGDILHDPVTNALFEVLKVDFGMALLEIKTNLHKFAQALTKNLRSGLLIQVISFGFTWIMNMHANGSKQILKFAHGRYI